MQNVFRNLIGLAAAALMLISLGCEPAKPPAPVSDDSSAETDSASDNTTENTTAAAETPVGETPVAEEAAEEEAAE